MQMKVVEVERITTPDIRKSYIVVSTGLRSNKVPQNQHYLTKIGDAMIVITIL